MNGGSGMSETVVYRPANFADVEALYHLLSAYAKDGLMLPRARSVLYENLRDFIVAEVDGVIVGAGSLHFLWDRLAEVRSLAIAPDWAGKGLGREIVRLLEAQGALYGVTLYFALTYQPGFFSACGYEQADKELLPQKVWKECVYCPKYPDCDEIAMIKRIG